MTIELFDTLTPATDGVVLPLLLPDGSPSDHWLRIRGRDAEPFRRAEYEAQRAIQKLGERGATFDAIEAARLDMLVTLVIGWSLDEDCTPDNVRRLLRVAPQIGDALDRAAADRALFFRRSSASSTSTPDGHANSKGDPPAASKPSGAVSNRSSAQRAAALPS